MNLSADQLKENFDVLLKVIDTKIASSPHRHIRLVALHQKWCDRIATAPASTKLSYHNAFPGGYVLHVLNVIKAVGLVADVWKKMSGKELDFTQEEMYFAAVCHDLGKIGTNTEDNYLPCEEQWMLKKGQMYIMNPRIQYMKTAERSLMILQSEGIEMSEKEYLAIKLHDGLYEEANKSYYISYSEDYALKTSLPYILHQADLIASKSEEKR
jgi:hypothetical protein